MGYDYILDNYFKKNRRLKIKKISLDLEGQFNKQNILITYICSKILNLPTTTFIKVIKNFKGLPYRSKLIYNDKNLRIINNSKSTNLNSTINSIKNYNEIYLIIGGEAKEKNFEILLNYKDRIRYVYVFGKSGKFIEKKLNKSLIVKKFITLKFAVKKFYKMLIIKIITLNPISYLHLLVVLMINIQILRKEEKILII